MGPSAARSSVRAASAPPAPLRLLAKMGPVPSMMASRMRASCRQEGVSGGWPALVRGRACAACGQQDAGIMLCAACCRPAGAGMAGSSARHGLGLSPPHRNVDVVYQELVPPQGTKVVDHAQQVGTEAQEQVGDVLQAQAGSRVRLAAQVTGTMCRTPVNAIARRHCMTGAGCRRPSVLADWTLGDTWETPKL